MSDPEKLIVDPGYIPIHIGGQQRTEIHCHNCHKTFVAELDFNISGNHTVECPRCGHEHCRVIKDGKITGERWDSILHDTVKVSQRSVWKSSVIQARTSSVSTFLRDRWLNLGLDP